MHTGAFRNTLSACRGRERPMLRASLQTRRTMISGMKPLCLLLGTKSGGIPFGKKTNRNSAEACREEEEMVFKQGLMRYAKCALLLQSHAWIQRSNWIRTYRSVSWATCMKSWPPRNAAAAKSISAAGEAALPHLMYETWKDCDEEIVASCACAVRLINGAPGTRMLVEGYGSDRRVQVSSRGRA